MAVTALGGLVVSHSIRVGGYELDDAIVTRRPAGRAAADRPGAGRGAQDRDRQRDHERVGARAAEVAGRDLVTGLLRRASVDADAVRHGTRAAARPDRRRGQGPARAHAARTLRRHRRPRSHARRRRRASCPASTSSPARNRAGRDDRRRTAHHRCPRRRQGTRRARDRPPEASQREEAHPEVQLIGSLPTDRFPNLSQVADQFTARDNNQAFDTLVDFFVGGLAAAAQNERAGSVRWCASSSPAQPV